MQKKVFEYMNEYNMIIPGDRVIAGISGGADSVCLLHLLLELQKEVSFVLGVIHVHHGLRGEEARRDADYVEQWCREHGLWYRMYTYDVAAIASKEKLSVEEAGRKVRYEAFAGGQKEWGATRIALAHHQNDVAETMLHHLARGSSLTGLCSIRPVRNQYIRPLLCMNRAEIEQYLKDRHIKWCTDSTNQELLYTRNKIRHHVVSYLENEINPKTAAHMADTALDLCEAENYLEEQAEKISTQLVRREEGQVLIDHALLEQAKVLRKYILRRCFAYVAGQQKDFGRVHLAQLEALLFLPVGKSLCLPHRIIARRTYDGLILRKDPEQRITENGGLREVLLTIPGTCEYQEMTVTCEIFWKKDDRNPQKKTYTKWFDYVKIKGNLVMRTRRQGDYLVLYRSGGKKKLKDYFIDEKIPVEERDGILLLACGSEILWVVGRRVSESCKVDKNTEQILSVHIKGKDIHE